MDSLPILILLHTVGFTYGNHFESYKTLENTKIILRHLKYTGRLRICWLSMPPVVVILILYVLNCKILN